MNRWWQNAVVYQIYPMSFCDSNGDGVGDIPGIISKLDYIKELGVNVIWLSPVYQSPFDDNGYDISDYREINPVFGTMEDMDLLISEAGRRGLKIIMDLVINHTSDEHQWFKKALAGDPAYHDYYYWRNRPNNWGNFFGVKPWTKPEGHDEYYLHLFSPKQPDLNYHNPAVIREIKDIMRFWLDKGISGFRCDVINILWKDSLENGRPHTILTGREHYLSRPGLHKLLREFNSDVLSGYDCFTVGETVFVTPEQARELTLPERGELDMIFSFAHMDADSRIVKWLKTAFDPARFCRVLSLWQNELPWNSVYLENHDQPRSVSRYGDPGEYRARSAKMLAVLLLSLRGTPFIYQGEELGMTNFDFSGMNEVRDVEAIGVERVMKNFCIPASARWKLMQKTCRDNARTPMQWDGGPNAGFSSGAPWLRVNANHSEINAQDEAADGRSVLNFYKRMLALRAASKILLEGSFNAKKIDGPLFIFERRLDDEKATVLINFSPRSYETGEHGEVVISNVMRETFDGLLQPWEGLILR